MEYWAQHAPDDKTTYAAIIDHNHGQDYYKTESKAKSIEPIHFTKFAPDTDINDEFLLRLFGLSANQTSAVSIKQIDLSAEDAQTRIKMKEHVANRASRTVDKALLLEYCISMLSNESIFPPAFVLDKSERRSSVFSSSLVREAIDLVNPSGDGNLIQLKALLDKHQIRYIEQAPEERLTQIFYSSATAGDARAGCELLFYGSTVPIVPALRVPEAEIAKLCNVIAMLMGVNQDFKIPTKPEHIVLNNKRLQKQGNLVQPGIEFCQRTNDPAKKAKPTDNFFTSTLENVFKPGIISVVKLFPKAWSPTCTSTDLPDLIKNLKAILAAGEGQPVQIVIVSKNVCDEQYEWIKRTIADLVKEAEDKQDVTSWLYKNDDVKDPTFVERNFVLLADDGLDFIDKVLGMATHNPRLNFIGPRGLIVADGPIAELVNVQEKATECTLVNSAVIIRAVKDVAQQRATERNKLALAAGL